MLRLTKIQRQENLRKYVFEEYSRQDYCVRAATIFADAEFRVRAIRFNSAHFGVVAYSSNRGITESFAWQNEEEGRPESGHLAYYNVSSTTPRPADADAVVDDVLASSPSSSFAEFARTFVSNTAADVNYPCKEFRLELPKADAQVRVIRVRPAGADSANHEGQSSIPLSRKLENLINRIEYQCPSCLSINPFLAKECWDCHRARPEIQFHEVLSVLLRGAIKLTYALYVLLVLGFLLGAYLATARLMRPY